MANCVVVDSSIDAHDGPALLTLLRELWPLADASAVRIERLTGAMTNHVFRCSWEGRTGTGGAPWGSPAHQTATCAQEINSIVESASVVVRVAGRQLPWSQSILDLACGTAAAAAGIGPQLLLTFNNGRVEQFLSDYRTLTAADLRAPALSKCIASAMARFHFVMTRHLPANLEQLMSTPRKELAGLDPSAIGQPNHSMPTNEYSIWCRMMDWAVQLDDGHEPSTCWQDRVQRLKAFLILHFPSKGVVGHNDAQYGNIMLQTSQSAVPSRFQDSCSQSEAKLEDGQKGQDVIGCDVPVTTHEPRDEEPVLKLIDYDYACWSCIAFDIANHWCEWAADYHTGTPHVLDFNKFPTCAEQRHFLAAYLSEAGHEDCGDHAHRENVVNADTSPTACCSGIAKTEHVAVQDSALELHLSLKVSHQLNISDSFSEGKESCGGRHVYPSYIQRLRNAVIKPAVVRTHAQDSTTTESGSVHNASPPACQFPGNHKQDSSMRHAQDNGVPSLPCNNSARIIEDTISKLQVQCLAWTAASHLHWALWGFVQATGCSIDFDYPAYARQRLDQFEMVWKAVCEPLTCSIQQ